VRHESVDNGVGVVGFDQRVTTEAFHLHPFRLVSQNLTFPPLYHS